MSKEIAKPEPDKQHLEDGWRSQQSDIARKMAEIFEATSDLVAIVGADRKLLYINGAGRNFMGICQSEDLAKIDLLDLYSKTGRLLMKNEYLPKALRAGRHTCEIALRSREGNELPVSQVIIAHRSANNRLDFYSITARDISERKMAEKALHMFAQVFETTQEGIMITNADRVIQNVNPAFSVVTGYLPADVIGRKPSVLQSGRHDADFYRIMNESLQETGHWRGEIWNRRKNGEIYPEWLNISAIKDNSGRITNYVAVFSDISTIKSVEKRLAHLANHDPLTELPNRSLLADRIDQALVQAYRNQHIVAILFIDLDSFKPVNDKLGHRIGDLLLQAVAERLSGCVRECDTVARVGGDEFIIVLAGIEHVQDAIKVAQKIIDLLSTVFSLEGKRINISASIGISLYPENGIDMESLVKNADSAMYRAKQRGGNSFQIYHGK